MPALPGLEDTIAAISTATASSGIGIIRLSGRQSIPIINQIFLPAGKQKTTSFKSHTVYYGWIIRPSSAAERMDEVLVTVMRAPRSYTKEDVVEISCHGGLTSLRTILNVVLECGARLAQPGEFTKRAFLNGRIDLAQAEAVLDIIQSKTDAFLKVSVNQLKGDLSLELESIREELMHIYVELEAILNFPEDGIDAKKRSALLKDLQDAKMRVEKLISSSDHGRILKEGIKIVICGKPNVGKSSLLNVLLRQPRAIVSPVAGTTRDTIEETAQIQGIPFQLVDTAGILEPRDFVEEEAIRRSHLSIQGADLVLLILDASAALSDEDITLMQDLKTQNMLVVLNKSDLPLRISRLEIEKMVSSQFIITFSALHKTGLEALESAIVERAWQSKTFNTQGILISNVRHIQSLRDCQAALLNGQQAFDEERSWEFVSEEIKRAVNCLDAITGRSIDEDLLDNIFSQFCIGK
jgi:tRNA modification GTPase